MNVLIACECSGIVRDAFAARGHNAWSCDLKPSERAGTHIQGDVLNVLDGGWDLLIAHPDCTYLCNSGVRWLHERPERWALLDQACRFFRRLWDSGIPQICIENPVPHKYAVERIGANWTQTVQPWQFGDGYVKRTCFWLRGLSPLVPTNIVSGRVAAVHLESPGPQRKTNRSRTYSGIANAMADQWGAFATTREAGAA